MSGFRGEVRDWLAAHIPDRPLPSVDTAAGFDRHRAWERELAAARLAVVSWPASYGGRDASLADWLVFEEEYHAAGAPARVGQNGLFLLAPTLFAHGTAEQRDRLLPRMARADDVWAQAWSEPDAGSDLAAIRARGTRMTGGWRLSGTKTWSSRAAFADRAFGLFRTDPAAGRHGGLSYLMFDLRAPGVTVRPIRQLSGETGFAEIFLDDVFVPDADVIGAPGDGWRVAMSTASHERGLTLRSPGRFLAAAARLVELWQHRGDPADTALRDRVADAWIGARAYQLRCQATAERVDAGGLGAGGLGAEASLGKVFWSELDLALHETALDLLGPEAELRDVPPRGDDPPRPPRAAAVQPRGDDPPRPPRAAAVQPRGDDPPRPPRAAAVQPRGDDPPRPPRAAAGGHEASWADGYLFALAGPIYAGTNEIQRTVIAQRLLGLPR